MRIATKAVLAAAGALAAWVGWGAYVRHDTEQVPYATVAALDDVEVRRYPRSVLVETTAADDSTAFRRLFRYISGENEGSVSVEMTAPVATGATSGTAEATRASVSDRLGASIPMTSPVSTTRADGEVTMAFYLPASYSAESAPVPTDPAVRLVVEPARTVAAVRFSWDATPDRVADAREGLLSTLNREGVETRGNPRLLRYDDPWTPPFMRRNEVVVPVDPDADFDE